MRIGIAQRPIGPSLEALLRVADEAMYAAKQAGRDRIESRAPGLRSA